MEWLLFFHLGADKTEIDARRTHPRRIFGARDMGYKQSDSVGTFVGTSDTIAPIVVQLKTPLYKSVIY